MLRCIACQRVLDDDERSCPADGSPLVTLAPGPPLIDGRYSLCKVLGSGSSGLVVVAEHLGLRRPVAVKMLDPGLVASADQHARFRREAETLARLDHPNIIRVTDFGIDPRKGGIPYLVMDLVEGESLRARLRRSHRLGPSEALPIIQAIGAALDGSHHLGICHRDLKPENVMLSGDEQTSVDACQVRVVDLGLAELVHQPAPAGPGGAPAIAEGSAAASSQGLAGTPDYMAPEVLGQGRSGPSADIYSLGALTYELLTGSRPFTGTSQEVSLHHLCTEPEPPSTVRQDLPRELDPIILKALAKEPSARFSTAGQMVRRMRSALELAARRERARLERPGRLMWAMVCIGAALLVTWSVADSGVARGVDHGLLRAGFWLSAPRAPDPRLLLISVDEQTARREAELLSGRADDFGELLGAVLAAGAEVVGLDLLLPAQWSRSESFTDLLIGYPGRITLALADRDGAFIGDACLRGPVTVALGPERSASLLGIVNVDVEQDGAVYQVRTSYRSEDGRRAPSFAARVATLAGMPPGMVEAPSQRRWIDYSTSLADLPRVSWSRLREVLEHSPEVFSGRIVLVGLELTGGGDRYHGLPRLRQGRGEASGLELQALMISSLLRGRPVSVLRGWSRVLLACGSAVLLGVTLLLAQRPWRVLAVAGLVNLVLVGVSLGLLRWLGAVLTLSEALTPQAAVIAGWILVRGRLRHCPRHSGQRKVSRPGQER